MGPVSDAADGRPGNGGVPTDRSMLDHLPPAGSLRNRPWALSAGCGGSVLAADQGGGERDRPRRGALIAQGAAGTLDCDDGVATKAVGVPLVEPVAGAVAPTA